MEPTRTSRSSLQPWHFLHKDPKSKAREATQGEFFNNEDIKDAAVALIREDFQNTLDQNVVPKVRIRVTLSGKERALKPEVAAKYFEGFWRHMNASYPEYETDISEYERLNCSFIVIEDFGTTGLTGDELAADEPTDKNNNFYYFFRAEGKSGKSGDDKGRWGIGKFVFPKSSDINAFFALTIREDDSKKQPLLMGQTILRNHVISGEGSYEPDGWFAIDGDEVFEPFRDEHIIRDFCGDWNVSRSTEAGLSIVIPYVEELTTEDVLRAIIDEYTMVILQDQLEVELVPPSGDMITLARHNIREEAARIFAGAPNLEGVLSDIDLLIWSLNSKPEEIVTLSEVGDAPSWSVASITEDEGTVIRSLLENQGKVIVRTPVKIRSRNNGESKQTEKTSYFDVAYWKDDVGASPVFYREGIKISSVRSKSSHGIRAVVIIHDGVLAGLLGDAEGPAHIDWEYRTLKEKYRGKYTFAENWITFVKRSPKRILDIAQGADREGDRTIAASWFPDVTEGNTKTSGGPSKSGSSGSTKKPNPNPPPPRPKKIRTGQVPGGFNVKLTNTGGDVKSIEIRAAYDIRSGDPFRRWSPSDFEWSGLAIAIGGGSVIREDGCRLLVEVSNPTAFFLEAKGFDINRDVAIATRFST